MSGFAKLYTCKGENIEGMPWNVYPRPMLKRDSIFCLNGEWELAVIKGDDKQNIGSITVPFSPETLLSGVCRRFDEKEYDCLEYRKLFSLPEGFDKGRVILNFEAVGNHASVVLNGKEIGSHIGGYDPFCFDITDVLKEENELIVKAKNVLADFVQPYGKQCRKRGGMWYTETTGIWQSVWLESVGKEYVRSLFAETKDDSVTITADGIDEATVTLYTDGGEKTYGMTKGRCVFSVENRRTWSPEDPYLYYYKIESEHDKVESYFAFRTLEIKKVDGYERLCLNGSPYFFHGLLDQGYWSDGGMTPPSPESYKIDIEAMKSLGFNMLRKHIKIEARLFYYECDRLGMVVFQDMINNGKYSFLRDTALPTVGIKDLSDKNMHKDKNTRETFVSYMKKTVDLLKGHPSICYWTIFNEGWGQFTGSEMYKLLKGIDGTRFIDTASGWFKKVDSDVDSEHIYFRKVKLKAKKKPLVLSEFGGYSYRIKGHSFNMDNEYGYGKFTSREEFAKAFCRLYTDEILPLVDKGLCASVYTQVSDVEDETNGLFTYDRRVLKITPEEFSDISAKLKI